MVNIFEVRFKSTVKIKISNARYMFENQKIIELYMFYQIYGILFYPTAKKEELMTLRVDVYKYVKSHIYTSNSQ